MLHQIVFVLSLFCSTSTTVWDLLLWALVYWNKSAGMFGWICQIYVCCLQGYICWWECCGAGLWRPWPQWMRYISPPYLSSLLVSAYAKMWILLDECSYLEQVILMFVVDSPNPKLPHNPNVMFAWVALNTILMHCQVTMRLRSQPHRACFSVLICSLVLVTMTWRSNHTLDQQDMFMQEALCCKCSVSYDCAGRDDVGGGHVQFFRRFVRRSI